MSAKQISANVVEYIMPILKVRFKLTSLNKEFEDTLVKFDPIQVINNEISNADKAGVDDEHMELIREY